MNLFKHLLRSHILASTLLILISATPIMAQQLHTGQFEDNGDIGNVRASGSVSYDSDQQIYTVTGGGYNMWGTHDEFHMVWKKLEGDFLLRTRPSFIGDGEHAHRKMGVIIRSELDSSSKYVDVAVHGDGLTSMQYRSKYAGETQEVVSEVNAPNVIELSRVDGVYTMSVAKEGDAFTRDTLSGVALGDEVYAGLFVCSHKQGVTEQARFSNVRIVRPAPDELVPYEEYIGSNLEVVNVNNGHRKIHYQVDKSIQAPNWTPDGNTLIYNSEGLLYNFNLNAQTPSVLNTEFADQNNNDHVLSFDGKQIGISHHAEEHNGNSIIYTLPTSGGTPQKVTDKGPSYLHGWSPDGKYLTYTAERNGQYDIYKIPSNGGKEIQLTNQSALDDGSEYAPNGKHIYFNSARTGSMEIWRMNQDGSNPKQLTDDKFNNWFPHISPDGKHMVFLSYLPEVDAGDHPFYKHVYLRMMPVDGSSKPKVLAYVYGGQGTINVPSWSPDGDFVSFISNTRFD